METYGEFFCHHCQSCLNNQEGFDPSRDFWTCKNCGEELYGESAAFDENFDGVIWYCDNCKDILNKQENFVLNNGEWECTKCQFVNTILEDNILFSKSEKESYIKLKELLNKLENYEADTVIVEKLTCEIEMIEKEIEDRVAKFDEEHKEPFISQLVEKPKRIPVWVKVSSVFLLLIFSIPLFVYDAIKYKKKIKIYNEEYLKAEFEYFEKYKKQREELLLLENEESEKATLNLKEKLKIAIANQSESARKIVSDKTVTDDLKNVKDIKLMIEYFDYGRVESLKEAINLLFEEKRKEEEEIRQEKYRQEMLNLQREQVKAAEEAAYYAKKAAKNAENAQLSATIASLNSLK